MAEVRFLPLQEAFTYIIMELVMKKKNK